MRREACPCGKVPEYLLIDHNGKGPLWAVVSGDCCGEWAIEFNTKRYHRTSVECGKLSIQAWNDAPRGKA